MARVDIFEIQKELAHRPQLARDRLRRQALGWTLIALMGGGWLLFHAGTDLRIPGHLNQSAAATHHNI